MVMMPVPGDVMMETNGYSDRRTIRVTLACMDCILIVVGVFASEFLIFGETGRYYSINEISVWRIVAFVLAIQIPFYWFELYKLIYLRDKKKMALRLLGSLVFSLLLLAILSYSVPYLSIRRAVAAVTIAVIFVLTLSLRYLFAVLFRELIKERILIVGSGKLSQTIVKDINGNGRDSYEIVGFVEE